MSSSGTGARIDALTDGQRRQLQAHADRWTALSLQTGPADRAGFEAAARRCYELAGFAWPGRVIWVRSPLMLMLVAPIAAAVIGMRDGGPVHDDGAYGEPSANDVRDAILGGVRAAAEVMGRAVDPGVLRRVDLALRESAAAAGRDAVANGIESALRSLRTGLTSTSLLPGYWHAVEALTRAVCNAVHAAVEEAAGGRLGGDLARGIDGFLWLGVSRRRAGLAAAAPGADPVREALRVAVGVFESIGVLTGGGWQGRPAVTSFLREVCGIQLEGNRWDLVRAYEQAVRSAGGWYPHRDFVVVCERPVCLHLATLTQRGQTLRQLHRTDGPAVAWPDGWGLYVVQGRRIPAWIFEQPDRISMDDIQREPNAEVRRLMIERYGWARFIREMGARVVDHVGMDHEIGGLRGARLLRRESPDGREPVVFLQMRNSTPEPNGSHRSYFERIDPSAYGGDAGRLCHAAMASRWRHRDADGRLRLTFERWQDYRPTAES